MNDLIEKARREQLHRNEIINQNRLNINADQQANRLKQEIEDHIKSLAEDYGTTVSVVKEVQKLSGLSLHDEPFLYLLQAASYEAEGDLDNMNLALSMAI